MLPAPGNADDGNGEQQAKKQVRKRNPHTADQDPYNVEDRSQTTRLPRHIPHLAAKWQQGKEAYLKTL